MGGQRGAGRIAAQDTFRVRMENQCKQIEQYRLAVLRHEDRLLSMDEAGLEWIRRYAEDFSIVETATPRPGK